MELCAFQSEEKFFHHINVDHPNARPPDDHRVQVW